MIHQMETLWRQTRDLPPKQLAIVNQLFSEVEHINQKVDVPPGSDSPFQVELDLSLHQTYYYEPRWFSTNGQIQ